MQAWLPHFIGDMEELETVQRRDTRMMGGGRDNLDYETRLQVMGLTALETRRIGTNMIEVYNILNGLEGNESGACS